MQSGMEIIFRFRSQKMYQRFPTDRLSGDVNRTFKKTKKGYIYLPATSSRDRNIFHNSSPDLDPGLLTCPPLTLL